MIYYKRKLFTIILLLQYHSNRMLSNQILLYLCILSVILTEDVTFDIIYFIALLYHDFFL